MSVKTNKSTLRQQLRAARKSIPPASRQRAARAAARLALRLPAIRRAQYLALYLAQGSELATLPLLHALWREGKKIYLPCVHGSVLRFRLYTPSCALLPGAYGIARPQRGAPRSLRRMDVVLLPLLGFDHTGLRLGAGGGFYDRALQFQRVGRRPLRVGYSYALQQVLQLPSEPWDVKLDAVITEQKVLLFP